MILLDTGFIVALELETDENHQKALEIYNGIINKEYGEAYVSDYIFSEAVTLTLSRTNDLRVAVKLGSAIKNSYNVLSVDSNIVEKAWDTFKEQKGPVFSFTDCSSIVLMHELGIKQIATFDRGFRYMPGISVV